MNWFDKLCVCATNCREFHSNNNYNQEHASECRWTGLCALAYVLLFSKRVMIYFVIINSEIVSHLNQV